MRRLSSAAAAAAALVCTPAAVAADPASVYNDYASDGSLSCNYSRADLEAALSDASLQQYGDPYTLVGLKLAVRRQLAGGCRAAAQRNHAATASGIGSRSSRNKAGSANGSRRISPTTSTNPSSDRASTPPSSTGAAKSHSNSKLLLGAALLLVSLGTGGWTATRALAKRR